MCTTFLLLFFLFFCFLLNILNSVYRFLIVPKPKCLQFFLLYIKRKGSTQINRFFSRFLLFPRWQQLSSHSQCCHLVNESNKSNSYCSRLQRPSSDKTSNKSSQFYKKERKKKPTCFCLFFFSACGIVSLTFFCFFFFESCNTFHNNKNKLEWFSNSENLSRTNEYIGHNCLYEEKKCAILTMAEL